ncbi:helix-turn-helix domain-containing protein [Bifidobacterium amazonense]|uniref:Helix-turn-helix domain-containing protein n=1 Tax=Bifidobacterium amazonense TaxID=2809027 RepID=A0ABS9VSB0_9BIFI|nr:helix-turn-helix domain-containing protein [Bifidobacterium amazonense]MCH9274977.1 helix-turn-helix domain-containing protein [Bifidobacterium amazonense]
MSIELVARAKKTRLKGDSTTKLLLIVLADYANDDRQAWPSVATLAAEVEVGDRTIQRSLRKLKTLGLITEGDQRLTKGYPKGQKPVVYQVFPERKPRHKTGVTHDTGTGDIHDTPTGDIRDTPTGDTTVTPTGDTHVTTPVVPMTPPRCHPSADTGDTHVTQTVIEPPIQPSRESTRTRNTTTDRLKALAAFTPNDEHQQLAAQYGVDCEWELRKFRNKIAETGKPPADPAAAFTNWLDRARELGLTTPPALAEGVESESRRRARKLLTSSRPVRARQPDESVRLQWVPQVAALLDRGVDPVAIVDMLAHGDPDELAAKGILVDDLAAIA